jgi:DNA-binding MarR family transcriptional regulator
VCLPKPVLCSKKTVCAKIKKTAQDPAVRQGFFLKKALDIFLIIDIVHAMNDLTHTESAEIAKYQLQQFQELITKLFQCCQERMQYQSEKFDLPDAELRCLLLFGNERYLTSTGIAQKMNLVKSRISKIIDGLIKKGLIQRIKDPEDSRISLLSLTSKGQTKLNEINEFLDEIHYSVLQQMAPEQRKTLLINLDLLKASMESVKELMV